MIVAVDAFNMGAMENKGLNIFNSSCVLAKPETTTDLTYQRIEAIVAHEYFHNWSGNRVTCRDWFQLSLKEGLTVYRDSQFSADMGSKTVKRIDDVALLRTVQFAEDAGPMAHPVRPDSFMEISNFYTVTIYEKGAELIRMMHHLVGDAGFRRGTDLYFDRHDGQAVTTEDFVKALEDANQVDLTQFSRWYSQSGTPVLKISDQYDAQNQQYRLTVEQSCPATPGQPHKKPFHIPLLIGLLDTDGTDLPLSLQNDLSGVNGSTSLTLEITSEKQQFVFENIPERPTPSLLRGFSAPVKLEYDYSSTDLEFLAQHDSDGFNRWDALQKRFVVLILDFAEKLRQGEEMELPTQLISICSSVLAESENDPQLAAKMLSIPTEAYLWELVDEIDVESIHRAREFVKQELAAALNEPLLRVYREQSSNEIYQATSQQMARRSLKNLAMQYLVWSGEERWLQMATEQASSGSNMTDVSAALGAIVNSMAPQAGQLSDKALDQFFLNWKHEPLVVNQWLALQAGCPREGALQRVEKLLEHDAFDIRNPNKVRSVVGVFCAQNRIHFHHIDGNGYRFLEQQVIRLDGINPQIASRLLTPLTQWGKHNKPRQTLMKQSLSKILEKGNLSKDVYEVASKSLG
jgi:aminopeptidase N